MKCKKNRNQTKHKQQTNRPITTYDWDASSWGGCWIANKEPQELKRRKRRRRYNWTLNYVNCIFKHFIDDIISFFYFRVLFLCFLCIRFAHTHWRNFCGVGAFHRYIHFVIQHSAQHIANCEANEKLLWSFTWAFRVFCGTHKRKLKYPERYKNHISLSCSRTNVERFIFKRDGK